MRKITFGLNSNTGSTCGIKFGSSSVPPIGKTLLDIAGFSKYRLYYNCSHEYARIESMLELNRQVRDLFVSYQRKSLKPETALELVSDFVLDLINVFGDTLDQGAAPKEKWRLFAPFEFILGLNKLLERYKSSGYASLEPSERVLLADNTVLLGTLIRHSLTSHPDAYPDEEHYQIPEAVATELVLLSES